ncbi:hypothetical protein AB432_019690 [Brevibacillus brevis]|uniref:Uncharacterized protein n=1 Tax=Brevibacillus brevis TaxID=1393 RepID=A0A2Z4MRV2_BREBE|nr:hypothetical protein AB432_019690 [Brevibacillus brevis]
MSVLSLLPLPCLLGTHRQ